MEHRSTDSEGPADPFEEPGYPGLTTSSVEARATQTNEKGMHEKYVVLSKEEREKGFIRPLRRSYIHKTCGVQTHMGLPLCETYARDPEFYGRTYCCGCRDHLPVSEFEWDEDGATLGT